MKRILIATAALLCVFVQSCDLSEVSYTEPSKDSYVTNASEAETRVLNLYRDMLPDGMYGYHLSLLFTLSSDIAQCEGSGTTSFRTIPTNAHNASTSEIGTTWFYLYSGIYDANEFIETVTERMKEWSEDDQALATVYLGEARAVRALFNFELVRWYGHIVLMKSTADSRRDPSTYTQEDPENVYKFIEEDLLYAADVLPWATDDALRKDNSYRMSKGSALGLLSKVYATWAGYPLYKTDHWADAASAAEKVIVSGKHSLNPSFEQLWYNTCSSKWEPQESLIEVSFYSSTSINTDNTAGRIGKWNGVVATTVSGVRGRNAGNWKVTFPFTDEWLTHDDPRCKISIANYKYAGSDKTKTIYADYDDYTSSNAYKSRQLFTPGKWDTEKYVSASNYIENTDKSNVNWYILRYADVLLLYSEAMNEAYGPDANSLAAINLVRQRAFGDNAHDVPATVTKEEFREIIHKERAYELAFEGHRKQDLIRWGTYYEDIVKTAQAIVDKYSAGNYTVADNIKKGKHELMPIPQRDLDLMKEHCVQNPGWGE